jgi:hypothetical protein
LQIQLRGLELATGEGYLPEDYFHLEDHNRWSLFTPYQVLGKFLTDLVDDDGNAHMSELGIAGERSKPWKKSSGTNGMASNLQPIRLEHSVPEDLTGPNMYSKSQLPGFCKCTLQFRVYCEIAEFFGMVLNLRLSSYCIPTVVYFNSSSTAGQWHLS